MELTFAQQTTAFLYSLALGLCFGAFYECLRFLRMLFNAGKAATAVADIFYMLSVSVCLFLFSVAFLQGYVRIYVIIGSAVGFSAFKLTVGRLAAKIYCPVIIFFRKISLNIHNKLKKITKKLLKKARNILYNISKRSTYTNKSSEKANEKRVIDSNERQKYAVKKPSARKGNSGRGNKGNKA